MGLLFELSILCVFVGSLHSMPCLRSSFAVASCIGYLLPMHIFGRVNTLRLCRSTTLDASLMQLQLQVTVSLCTFVGLLNTLCLCRIITSNVYAAPQPRPAVGYLLPWQIWRPVLLHFLPNSPFPSPLKVYALWIIPQHSNSQLLQCKECYCHGML